MNIGEMVVEIESQHDMEACHMLFGESGEISRLVCYNRDGNLWTIDSSGIDMGNRPVGVNVTPAVAFSVPARRPVLHQDGSVTFTMPDGVRVRWTNVPIEVLDDLPVAHARRIALFRASFGDKHSQTWLENNPVEKPAPPERKNDPEMLAEIFMGIVKQRADKLDFGWALLHLKWGRRVTREGWDGIWLRPDGWDCIWLRLCDPDDNGKPSIRQNCAMHVPWTPTQEDLLATDWRIVDG